MSKYAALQYFLERAPASRARTTFAEIEQVIGALRQAEWRGLDA